MKIGLIILHKESYKNKVKKEKLLEGINHFERLALKHNLILDYQLITPYQSDYDTLVLYNNLKNLLVHKMDVGVKTRGYIYGEYNQLKEKGASHIGILTSTIFNNLELIEKIVVGLSKNYQSVILEKTKIPFKNKFYNWRVNKKAKTLRKYNVYSPVQIHPIKVYENIEDELEFAKIDEVLAYLFLETLENEMYDVLYLQVLKYGKFKKKVKYRKIHKITKNMIKEKDKIFSYKDKIEKDDITPKDQVNKNAKLQKEVDSKKNQDKVEKDDFEQLEDKEGKEDKAKRKNIFSILKKIKKSKKNKKEKVEQMGNTNS